MVDYNVTIRGAKIIFRNFSGKQTKFNPAGRRNFCVILDDETARKLEGDGWNVRYLEPRGLDEDKPTPYLQVSVSWSIRPPKIKLISSRGETSLGEDEVSMLDWEEITKVDLVLRPYNWEIGDKKGVKAYLKSMHVSIEEDELDMPVDEELPF